MRGQFSSISSYFASKDSLFPPKGGLVGKIYPKFLTKCLFLQNLNRKVIFLLHILNLRQKLEKEKYAQNLQILLLSPLILHLKSLWQEILSFQLPIPSAQPGNILRSSYWSHRSQITTQNLNPDEGQDLRKKPKRKTSLMYTYIYIPSSNSFFLNKKF